MNDFEKIEHLLLHKKYEELSPTEVREVTGYFENASDYNDMRDTLLQVKSTLTADKLLIKPSVELKEKLLQQFDKTYTNQASPAAKTRPFFKNIGFQWSVAASVVIIISLSIFGYVRNMNGHTTDGMAVNYKSPSHKNDHTESTVNEEPATIKDGRTGHVITEDLSNKDRVTTVNPEFIGTARNGDELGKTKIYGNYFKPEAEVMEGDMVEDQNAPLVDTKNKLMFTSQRDEDNTTTIGTEKNRDDANYYFNDKVLTNAYKENMEPKTNDEKKSELLNGNLGISEVNTTVNYNQTTNLSRTNLAKKKDKNRQKNNQQTLGGVQVSNLKQKVDTLSANADSLKLDSNKMLLEKSLDIQMDDNKKQGE
jgi:hypothetical protein